MNKKLIRLTEQDLHRIVKESVKRIINEIGDTPKGQLALGAVAGRANVRGNRDTEIAASNKAWDRSMSKDPNMNKHYDSGYELGKDMERDKQLKQRLASRLKEDIIKESVKKVLSELDWKTYANAAKKANQRTDSRYNKFLNKATDEFNKEYGYSEGEGYYDPNVEFDGINLRATNNDNPSHSLRRFYDYDPETDEYSNPYNYDDGRAMGLDSFMGDRYPRYKNPSLKKFFDNPEQEKAYKRASDEMDNYKLGKSKYVKGQGWQ